MSSSAPTTIIARETIPDLPARLDELVRSIPAGQVASYGVLADALGNRIAARWVAGYLIEHQRDRGLPAHRVVKVDGTLSSLLAGGIARQTRKLRAEGIRVAGEQVDIEQYGFTQFEGPRPLVELRERQKQLHARLSLDPPRKLPDLIGGVDVSYGDGDTAVAAYTLVDRKSKQLRWSLTHSGRARFPYISTYLAYREVPLHLELLERVQAAGKLAPVLLVDGSGILHARHLGIASHLGIVADLPTIGVAKTLPCGSVDITDIERREHRPVIYEQQEIARALRPDTASTKVLYVSPGHRTSVRYAIRVVVRLLASHRLPEPLYWADRLSREQVKRER